MELSVDLEKSLDLRKGLILELKKSLNILDVKARVFAAIDYSGSMSHLYRSGVVQNTMERLLPVALAFDDDKKIEVLSFHNDVFHLPEADISNISDYVQKNFKGHMGGTVYSKIIYSIMEKLNLKESTSKSSFFGLFKPKSVSSVLKEPVYVIIITDGDCNYDDKKITEEAIKEASNYGIFFQFVGIGDERFAFLEKLDTLTGRKVDNAGFFKIKNLNSVTDEALYSQLMQEFPSWYNKVKSLGIIQP